MTEPYDPEDAHEDVHEPGAPPSSERGPAPEERPTEPGWARPDDPPAAGSTTPAGARPSGRTGWRSHRVRTGVVATIAALALLGGGFGAGYAVADANSAATHARAAKGHHKKGAARAERMRSEQQGRTAPGRAT